MGPRDQLKSPPNLNVAQYAAVDNGGISGEAEESLEVEFEEESDLVDIRETLYQGNPAAPAVTVAPAAIASVKAEPVDPKAPSASDGRQPARYFCFLDKKVLAERNW